MVVDLQAEGMLQPTLPQPSKPLTLRCRTSGNWSHNIRCHLLHRATYKTSSIVNQVRLYPRWLSLSTKTAPQTRRAKGDQVGLAGSHHHLRIPTLAPFYSELLRMSGIISTTGRPQYGSKYNRNKMFSMRPRHPTPQLSQPSSIPFLLEVPRLGGLR